MSLPCDLCAAIDPTEPDCTLQQHLRAGQQRRIADNAHAAAVPTIGAFVPGYLLIVPTTHTTSLGRLPASDLAGVRELTERMAGRLRQVYGRSVLGFEYGLNVTGARRIEHGHLHLLPTEAGAALRHYLNLALPMDEVASLRQLPSAVDRSYISVWEPGKPVSVYPVANTAAPRIRLREVIAQLDPRVLGRHWDWQVDPCADLMQATADALMPGAGPEPVHHTSVAVWGSVR